MAVDIRIGDARAVLRDLPDSSVRCVITAPPVTRTQDAA